MRYKIVCHNKAKNKELLEKLYFLLSKGNESEHTYDFLFLIGGDGTLISGLKDHFHQNIKIVHIKSGTNSFFGEMFKDKKLDQFINALQDTSCFSTYQVMRIEKNKEVFFAINDLYIQGSLLLESHIYINQQYFQKFKGSALLFSTQIGSTGLNKSAQSPIVFPELKAWIMSSIHTQVNKDCVSIANPLIVSEKEVFDIHLLTKNHMIFLDNRRLPYLPDDISVKIKVIRSTAQLFKSSHNIPYINNLNSHFSNSKSPIKLQNNPNNAHLSKTLNKHLDE